MHNALNRLQTAFGFFTSCAFTLAGIIALLSIIPFPSPTGTPSASISLQNVQVVKGRPHYYSQKREEYAQIRFDLKADLSSLFTWNTKQVFVYVTANYPNKPGDTELSEAVIWDTIIPAPATPYSWTSLKTRFFPKSAKSSIKSRRSTGNAGSTDLTRPGLLTLKNQKPKYTITDPSGKIAEKKNCTLQVSWNVQPWVGALIWDKGIFGNRVAQWQPGEVGRSKAFDFPSLKGSKTDVVKDTDGPKTPKGGEASPVVNV